MNLPEIAVKGFPYAFDVVPYPGDEEGTLVPY
jgi:hypothetical protein